MECLVTGKHCEIKDRRQRARDERARKANGKAQRTEQEQNSKQAFAPRTVYIPKVRDGFRRV